MTPHRVRVHRVDRRLPWRVQCTCGLYSRWLFWSEAQRHADRHTHPSATRLGGAA